MIKLETMKREIKFRAWNANKKIMIDLDCNYIVLDGFNEIQTIEIIYGYASGFELMQFTGLKDKNGVEIYEGDILAFERTKDFKKETVSPFTVTWSSKNAGWINFSPKDMVVVIGNIHENKHLIK